MSLKHPKENSTEEGARSPAPSSSPGKVKEETPLSPGSSKPPTDEGKAKPESSRNKVFFHEFNETTDDENDVGHRLYKSQRSKADKDKEESDAIVSDLSGETLRWLKKRREFGAEKKIVISSFREKQLREMFQSLDFEGNGAINLDELTEAVTYVQQKTKHSKGLEQFQNIQETFIAMDDNGDGTVDFSEFIHAMTGTSQSTFDKATEYDVERLFSYFIEYGELKQREMAYRKISEAQAQSIASPDSPKKDEPKLAPSDSLSVKHFKALFGATEESERKYVSRVTAKKQAKEASAKKSAHMDQILQDFIASNTKSPRKSFSLANLSLQDSISGHGSVDESSHRTEEEISPKFSSEDYLELQNRLKEERKEAIEQQNMILAEAGLLQKRKSVLRSSLRMSASHLPTLLEEQSTTSKKMNGSSSTTMLESTKSIHLHNTMIPSSLDTKQEIMLRSTAKREAYEIIRRPRTSFSAPQEESEFRVRASTFDTPHPVSQLTTPKASRRSSFADDASAMLPKSPVLTSRKSFNTRGSIDLTRRSVEFTLPEGSIRLPSIRGSLSFATNGSLVTGTTVTSSSKKNQMVRASFAF
jgi:hypothetical protein